MKYLVLLVVLVLAYAWWRSGRRASMRASRPVGHPTEMVACAHCGVHLPRTEALHQGPHYYCCAEHQAAHAAL